MSFCNKPTHMVVSVAAGGRFRGSAAKQKKGGLHRNYKRKERSRREQAKSISREQCKTNSAWQHLRPRERIYLSRRRYTLSAREGFGFDSELGIGWRYHAIPYLTIHNLAFTQRTNTSCMITSPHKCSLSRGRLFFSLALGIKVHNRSYFIYRYLKVQVQYTNCKIKQITNPL